VGSRASGWNDQVQIDATDHSTTGITAFAAPTLVNYFIDMIKGTSLAFTLA